jgi:hypothetical protein
MRRVRESGGATIEMTLLGIPIIFVLISIFEISRGMWMYETAAFAVREGVRYATVHGVNCRPNPPTVTNSCLKTAAQITAVIRNVAVGLDPSATQLTFSVPSSPGGTPVNCFLNGTGDAACANVWPADGANSIVDVIEIRLITPFNSALAMFWPGGKPVQFAFVNLGGSSTDQIQF